MREVLALAEKAGARLAPRREKALLEKLSKASTTTHLRESTRQSIKAFYRRLDTKELARRLQISEKEVHDFKAQITKEFKYEGDMSAWYLEYQNLQRIVAFDSGLCLDWYQTEGDGDVDDIKSSFKNASEADKIIFTGVPLSPCKKGESRKKLCPHKGASLWDASLAMLFFIRLKNSLPGQI